MQVWVREHNPIQVSICTWDGGTQAHRSGTAGDNAGVIWLTGAAVQAATGKERHVVHPDRVLHPCIVHSLRGQHVTAVAAAHHHTLFLTQEGQVLFPSAIGLLASCAGAGPADRAASACVWVEALGSLGRWQGLGVAWSAGMLLV